jgi:hypothetical protein
MTKYCSFFLSKLEHDIYGMSMDKLVNDVFYLYSKMVTNAISSNFSTHIQ